MHRWTFGLAPAIALSAWLLLPIAAPGQEASGHAGSTASPYAGQESRGIKALSDTDVQQLLDGAGMGFAKAAELNRYPGPRHVLDLAEALALSAEQRAATEAVFRHMRAEAVALGEALVAQERELDAGFAGGRMDAATLERLTGQLGRLQGQLRNVHLRAHLEMKRILSAHQVLRYERLRGYGAQPGASPGHGAHGTTN